MDAKLVVQHLRRRYDYRKFGTYFTLKRNELARELMLNFQIEFSVVDIADNTGGSKMDLLAAVLYEVEESTRKKIVLWLLDTENQPHLESGAAESETRLRAWAENAERVTVKAMESSDEMVKKILSKIQTNEKNGSPSSAILNDVHTLVHCQARLVAREVGLEVGDRTTLSNIIGLLGGLFKDCPEELRQIVSPGGKLAAILDHARNNSSFAHGHKILDERIAEILIEFSRCLADILSIYRDGLQNQLLPSVALSN